MHVTLVHNPTAGDTAHDGKQLTRLLQRQGYRVRYHQTTEDGLERRLATPGDLVVVAGGDGAVVQVAKSLAGRGIPLAVLPLGTANNVARTLGLSASVEQLIKALPGARRRAFDVGRIKGPELNERFIEGVGLGLHTEAMCRIDADPDSDESSDPLARNNRFLRLLARDFPPRRYSITADGEDLSGEYILVEALNIRTIGPVLALAPHADPADGRLDLVLAGEGERELLHRYLDARVAGEQREAGLPVRRAAEVRISGEGGALRVDDEIVRAAGTSAAPLFRQGSVTLRVERDALEFLVPA